MFHCMDRWKDTDILHDKVLWSNTTAKSCSLTKCPASCQCGAGETACTIMLALLGNTANMNCHLAASGDTDKTVKLFRDYHLRCSSIIPIFFFVTTHNADSKAEMIFCLGGSALQK